MKRIAIRDRAFRHAGCSNNPLPPVSRPGYFEWDFEGANPQIYTDAELFTAPDDIIAWFIEPIHGRKDAWDFIMSRAPFWREIWTHDRDLLAALPHKAKFVPLGGCWVKTYERRIWAKSRGVSTIASNKRGGIGYDLRHELIERLGTTIDAYGVNYRPLLHKIDALRAYRFQIVIENSCHDYWFTEKLLDCFATGTIPIYLGCPSIGEFFNRAGMFLVESVEQIVALTEHLNQNMIEEYDARRAAIAENYDLSRRYWLAEDYLVTTGILTP